ncbi:MAG: hypothetical protein L0Y57_02380 [Beijerinckiaceae bacterium]|nr:hypothetical protein [Beijerinckiaceae bacterium]
MTRDPAWLLQHKRDIYSQTGEDGIIETILSTAGERDGWCVELGAWDGQHLSNTRNLIESSSYKAVLIEGGKERWEALKAFYSGNNNVIPVNAFAGFGETNGLDAILGQTDIPLGFDFLSIDIDGNDFHVWNAMCAYKPKVICIEFNPTIPTDCDFVQPADPNVNQGASLSSIVLLGKAKGYELASVLQFNAFFVRNDLFPLLEIEDNSAQTLRKDLSYLTYLFQGFDGHLFLHGNRRLIWHGLGITEGAVQILPVLLQKYPENYRPAERWVFERYRNWLSIRQLFRKGQRFMTGRKGSPAK